LFTYTRLTKLITYLLGVVHNPPVIVEGGVADGLAHSRKYNVNILVILGLKKCHVVGAKHNNKASDLVADHGLAVKGEAVVEVAELNFHISACFKFVHLHNHHDVLVAILCII
jgi:hypothetical protein